MTMYKLTNTTSILRISDSAYIPVDGANTDYQAYLAWLAEGNVPEPVAPPTQEETLAKKVQECIDYLNKTDFYYPRFLETGESVPEEVVLKRNEARNFIRAAGTSTITVTAEL